MVKTEQNVLHALLANSTLWENPNLKKKTCSIHDGDLTATVRTVLKGANTESAYDNAFDICITGSQERLESFRLPLVSHLRNQHFDPLYILKDEVSEEIACSIYPLLYRVENSLRGYLIKFMSIRLGPEWWDLTAKGEWSKKVQQRKNNETVFSMHVDNNAYLIDFGDLGKMIYAQSSGFTSMDDIIKKVEECPETIESIVNLKEELKSNYHKFFKKSFKDKGFQAKWESLEKIRHKVAHNNLFTKADFDLGKIAAEELIKMIGEATESIDLVDILQEEKEAIRSHYVAQGLYFKELTEEKLLLELRREESFFHSTGGFVGITLFVKKHLDKLGYDNESSYMLIDRLKAEGKIETYLVENPSADHPTTAIRSVSDFTNS